MNQATFRKLLADATQRLLTISETPRLDAEILLAAAVNQTRSYLLAWPERVPEPELLSCFMSWLERRAKGEPVAYLLGQWEFWSLELEVTSDTLVPRPETEQLVALALEHVPINQAVRIADLGTGSGAIALALAVERPQAHIVATDISAAALAVARRNTRRLGLNHIEFRQGHWYQPLVGERFDLIVSNPPYVAETDSQWQRGALRFEPAAALVAGVDGLDALRVIIDQAPAYLCLGGWLLLEHGYDQGESTPALLRARGFTHVHDDRDSAGVSRVAGGQWGTGR